MPCYIYSSLRDNGTTYLSSRREIFFGIWIYVFFLSHPPILLEVGDENVGFEFGIYIHPTYHGLSRPTFVLRSQIDVNLNMGMP